MSPDTVVVLSYHGYDDTLRCVASLVDGSPAVEILVVDNGSHDGVLAEVASRWPYVSTLQTGANLGFSGGMNRGLDWALQRGSGTVTVLNNDTVVPPGAIEALAGRARSGPVAVSPEVRYAATGKVWFGGGTVDADTGLARHLTDAELGARFPGGQPRQVESLAGCSVTASAQTWRRVGLFDDRFFLLFEDADWSRRARAAGVSLVVDPSVTIDHVVSASFVGPSARLGRYYYVRNGLYFGSRARPTGAKAVVRAARFLRRHVVSSVMDEWRAGRRTEAARGAVIVALAVAHHVGRRHGRAPAWLERAVARDVSPG